MPIFIIVIGILLIYINYRALKRQPHSFVNILHNEENNMNDYKLEVGNLRREISETILELQKEIVELKEGKKYNYEEESNYDNLVHKNSYKKVSNDTDYTKIDTVIDDNVSGIKKDNYENEIQSENQVISRMNAIEDLINKGYSDEEICESLSMGKGEVLLIKGLLKQSKI